METFVTDCPFIRELHFDADRETLEIIFRSGETKVIHHVCRLGFDRFIGRTGE